MSSNSIKQHRVPAWPAGHPMEFQHGLLVVQESITLILRVVCSPSGTSHRTWLGIPWHEAQPAVSPAQQSGTACPARQPRAIQSLHVGYAIVPGLVRLQASALVAEAANGHKSKSPCRNCSTDSDSVCMTPHSIAPHTQHTSRDAQTDHCGNASHTTCSHNSHNNKRVTSPRHPLLQEDHHP